MYVWCRVKQQRRLLSLVLGLLRVLAGELQLQRGRRGAWESIVSILRTVPGPEAPAATAITSPALSGLPAPQQRETCAKMVGPGADR